MLKLQEAISQIYKDPKKLYFFTGPEYGVKLTYINILKDRYKESIEYPSFKDLIDTFKSKSLLPRVPTLYIVLYDSDFLKGLNANSASELLNAKIVGTAVGLYYEDKHEEKLDKFFPDNVLRVNPLSPNVMKKHLMTNFPKVPEMHVDTVIRLSDDYYEAQNICRRLELLPNQSLFSITSSDIQFLFKASVGHDLERFRDAIASRSYSQCMIEIENYAGELSQMFYDILNTLLEIIKVLEKPYIDSPIKKHISKWNIQSAKAMFNVTFDQLEKLRGNAKYPPEIAIMYTCSLLQFKLG